MRCPVRGLFSGLPVTVESCRDLPSFDHHTVELADVDKRIKTDSQPDARLVPYITNIFMIPING